MIHQKGVRNCPRNFSKRVVYQLPFLILSFLTTLSLHFCLLLDNLRMDVFSAVHRYDPLANVLFLTQYLEGIQSFEMNWDEIDWMIDVDY